MWHRVSRRLKEVFATVLEILKQAAVAFGRHRSRRFGAGLAYYSLFALVPTMFLSLAIVAAFFGEEATEGELVSRVDDVLGVEAAEQLEDAVASLWDTTNTSGFAIITFAVVVYSASILFVAWRDTLEAIWELPYEVGVKTSLRSRAFGALVPLASGLVLATLVLIEMLVALAADFITSPLLDALIQWTQSVAPTVVSIAILGALYRFSTPFRPDWRDVWPGTLVAALALGILAWGYGLYVRLFGSSSAAGAAGSVVLGLVFIYYAAQVLLFGAEVIRVTVDRREGSTMSGHASADGG